MEKRLYRSRSNRILWGVCGGLAEYFNVDPAIVRVVFVLLTVAWGIGIIAYIVLAIIAPLEGGVGQTPRDVVKENVQELKETTAQLGKEVQSSLSNKQSGKDNTPTTDERHHHGSWVGGVLIIIGLFFLMVNVFGQFGWFRWDFMWPIIIIIVGLLIIAGRRK